MGRISSIEGDITKGFCGKMVKIQCTEQTVSDERIDMSGIDHFLGGAGYAAHYLYGRVDKTTNPLGPDNPLIFMTGPLTGTAAPATGRWVVCAKSPATGIWGESNCGSHFGAELKFSGFDGIILEGAADHPVYVEITEDEQHIRDATSLWGLGILETHARLKKENPYARVACIGPAGESLVTYAIIGSENRAAGRTGMGAVMGSKKVKAIVVKGKKRKIDLADPGAFRTCVKAIHNTIKDTILTQMFRELGTSGGIDFYNLTGEIPVKFWTKGEFKGSYSISGATMKETILVRRNRCFACPIGCGRIVSIPEGPYAVPGEIEGPEYETIAGFGSQICNDDLESIAYLNYLCNDLGVDTISCSAVIALCYHLYDQGKITASDLDGIHPRWGSPQAAIDLIPKIAHKREIGACLADGADAVGQAFHIVPDHIPTVDGLEITYHDIRSCFGMAIAYATSPRGADHNTCDIYQTTLGQSFPELGIPSPDRYDDDDLTVQACMRLQDYRALYSSAILCLFCNPLPSQVATLLTAVTGKQISLEDMKIMGERIFALKRLFNIKMGLTAAWDRLPEMVLSPLEEGGSAGKRPDWRRMLSSYYRFRGWDPHTGIPSLDKMQALGLHEKWLKYEAE
jgi:aldehyde:ferredoxin oxidoreductase